MLKPVYIFWLFISIAIISVGLVFARVTLPVLPTLRPVRTYIQPGNISPTAAENITTENVTVDFGKQISTGSPLVFGGAHAPDLSHQDAWDKLADVGVTIIRRDFFIEWEVPRNITLTDYKNNVKDIQNPDNWNNTNTNWTNISITNQIYDNAKKRGMKVMGILSFVPAWLTYSGTANGVPKDWEVYEDIVRKLYKIHRKYLDYLEIWNEPTYPVFLDLTNSGMSREEAYKQIFLHATRAIRSVDTELSDGKKILIGGPVGHTPTDTRILNILLENDIAKSQIDFVSYHNYDHIAEPSWGNYKNILAKFDKSAMPTFQTEWNSSDKNKTARYSKIAIAYTGKKLISFLNMGLPMANYYAMRDLNRSKNHNDDPSFSFYKWENGKAELLPQASTWRLLSVSLGLGKGESKIFNTQSSIANLQLPKTISAAGFENTFGQKGLAIVNGQDKQESVTVTLQNFGISHLISGKVPLDVYIASADHDGGTAVNRLNLQQDNQGKISFMFVLPPQSVIGVIAPTGSNLRQFFRNLIPFIPR